MVAKESFALKYNIIDNALRICQTRGLGSMSIQILSIFDLRNYFVICFCCCGVIAIWANNDMHFDFDLLNPIQVFLSFSFPNKRFYSMVLGFDGDLFSPRKVQY